VTASRGDTEAAMYRPGQILQLLAITAVETSHVRRCAYVSASTSVSLVAKVMGGYRVVEILFRQLRRMRCPSGRRSIDHNQLRRYGKLHVHSSSPILYRIRTLVPIFATPHQNPSVQCLKRLFPTTATREDALPLSCGRSSSSVTHESSRPRHW
jgi:hypothetical protein